MFSGVVGKMVTTSCARQSRIKPKIAEVFKSSDLGYDSFAGNIGSQVRIIPTS